MTRTVTLLFPALVLFAASSTAQPTPQGDEFQVNTYTTEFQGWGRVALDTQGNFVVVWQSRGQDGDDFGIHGQLFAADGSTRGSEFLVNAVTTGPQRFPAMAMQQDGDFVVVWNGPDGDLGGIHGQRFASDGSRRGAEFQINTYTTYDQLSPEVASDATGDFVVVWNRFDSPPNPIVARRFASDGTALGGEIELGAVGYPYGALKSASGFIVVWGSDDFTDVSARRFGSDGTPVGGSFVVNSATGAYNPAIGGAANGDFIIAWDSLNDAAPGIRFQRFASDGTELGMEIQADSYVDGNVSQPDVASDASGNFTIVWRNNGADGDNGGIRGQQFASDGTFLGSELAVNTYTTGNQTLPRITAVSADVDSVVVVWQGSDGDSFGIQGRRYGSVIFTDGFESGSVSAWSSSVP